MKTSLRSLFASIAAVFLFAGAFIATVRAQAPTIITSAPYTISTPGAYQLGANLTVSASSGAIITIAASNVTLDFNGHYISGPSSTPSSGLYGVYAHEAGNLTIQNGTVAYCLYGIYLNGTGTATSLNINQRIDNMLVSYCYGIGVYLYSARNSDVVNSRISFIGGGTGANYTYGIYSTGTGLKFSNNEITNITSTTGTTYGIYGTTSSFSIGNTISNAYYGVYLGKYQNNLTNGCTAAVSSGTDCGGNF